MKNMKRLLALALALAMVLGMSACGSKVKGSVSAGDFDVSSTPKPTPDPASEPAPEATPESTPESTPEPASEPDDGLKIGSTVGGTYENSFAGIGCKLDGSWIYFSDEEILELNELTVDSIDDEELSALLSDKGTFYDMMAMSEEGNNVNVVVENLGLLYGVALDPAGYIDLALESLEDQLSLMGLNVTACEKDSFDFCGKAADGIYVAGTMSVEGMEVEMFERQVCVKAGTYMFCVTACTYFEDTTADILNLFYAV